MHFSCFNLESSKSPHCPGSFYWGMIFRNQDLGARWAHCSRGVIDRRPFQQTELEPKVYLYLEHELTFTSKSSPTQQASSSWSAFHTRMSLAETPTPVHSPFAQCCDNHRTVSDLVSDRKPIKSSSGFLSSSTAFKIEDNIIYGCVRSCWNSFFVPSLWCRNIRVVECRMQGSGVEARANVVCKGQHRKEPESQVKVWTLILYHWGAPEGF